MRHAVVVGRQGVIGRCIVDHLTAFSEWKVTGLSRRRPDFAVHLDADAEKKLRPLVDATHLSYCAFQPRPTWAEHNAPNLAMLINAVEPIAAASNTLEHVHLLECNKIYGSHLGPYKTPAKKTDPPHMLPNFYWD